MLCDDLEEWDEGVDGGSRGGGYIYIHPAESQCTGETSTTL